MTTTRVLFAVGCFLLGLPNVSRAEPITFTYHIDFVTRCFEAPVFQCNGAEPFQLRLTFEPTGRIREQDGNTEYGPPTFSGVPVCSRSGHSEHTQLSMNSATFSIEASGLQPDGTWVHHSAAESFHTAGPDAWGVRLSGMMSSCPRSPTRSARFHSPRADGARRFVIKRCYNQLPPQRADPIREQLVYRGRSRT